MLPPATRRSGAGAHLSPLSAVSSRAIAAKRAILNSAALPEAEDPYDAVALPVADSCAHQARKVFSPQRPEDWPVLSRPAAQAMPKATQAATRIATEPMRSTANVSAGSASAACRVSLNKLRPHDEAERCDAARARRVVRSCLTQAKVTRTYLKAFQEQEFP